MSWRKSDEMKPQIDQEDKWNKDNEISTRVAVWLEDCEYASFGRFYYKSGNWSVEGHMGFDQSKVKWWMYITNPYNKPV